MPKPMLIVLLALALFLTGCGGPDTPSSLGEEALDIMEDLVEVLEGVSDVDSATSAKPKIQKIADRLEDNFARRRALGDPTPEDQAEFESQHGSRAEAISERMAAEVTRIEGLGPEVSAEMDAGMRAILEIDMDREP